jgi:hypothetical protein
LITNSGLFSSLEQMFEVELLSIVESQNEADTTHEKSHFSASGCCCWAGFPGPLQRTDSVGGRWTFKVGDKSGEKKTVNEIGDLEDLEFRELDGSSHENLISEHDVLDQMK